MSKPSTSWVVSLVGCLLATLIFTAVFWPTLSTMVETWLNVETYSHGFLILPISLWLVWQRRDALFSIPPQPAPVVLLLTLVAILGWGLSTLLGIQIAEQLAFIAAWVTGIWAVIGHRAARSVIFPLLFLFMMVPMGDSLVPPMMDFTADFTIWMLEMSGIPVYREGLYFVIPSGNWSVVEACSGVRYLIASVTLGLLYAYLTYRSFWRRALFVLLAILVPILANGLRAYMIVMIGHLSDMKLAVGIDHLIYGWVFFGLVMLLLFWIGNFWIEKEPARSAVRDSMPGAINPPFSRFAMITVLALCVVLSVGGRAAVDRLGTTSAGSVAVQLPHQSGGWVLHADSGLDWPLRLQQPDQLLRVRYTKAGRSVTLAIGVFATQRQGREVISSENQLFSRDADNTWRVVSRGRLRLSEGGDVLSVPAYGISQQKFYLLGEDQLGILATAWYRLGTRSTSNEYLGKLYQALALLAHGRTDGAFVVLATLDSSGAPDRLQAFSEEALPGIWAALDAGR